MREKIISELKRLATEITLLDHNTSVDDLQEKAKKLYEKLTVLQYMYSSLDEKIPESTNVKEVITDTKASETLEDILADVAEPVFEPKDIVLPEPKEDINEIEVQPVIEEELMPTSNVDFADMFEAITPEPEVVKNDMDEVTPDIPEPPKPIDPPAPIQEDVKPIEVVSSEPKSKSLNDRWNTTIVVGLNDKIGFINHLFDGSSEDFNRVISQLNTIATEAEAKQFINTMIKPDYNNWEGKEEYEARLISLIENKFN